MARFSVGCIPDTPGTPGVYDHERGVWKACSDLIDAQMLAGRLNAAVDQDQDFLDNAISNLTWIEDPLLIFDYKVVYSQGDGGEEIQTDRINRLDPVSGAYNEGLTLAQAAEEACRLLVTGNGNGPKIVKISNNEFVMDAVEVWRRYNEIEQEVTLKPPTP